MEDVTVVFVNGNIVSFIAQEEEYAERSDYTGRQEATSGDEHQPFGS
jgi:hypothetical protein